MTTSPEKAGFGRRVRRYDTWIMVTGVVMFLLSFAPWEGLNPETLGNLGLGNLGLGNLGGLGNVPVGPESIYNAWHVGFGGWLPCLVALAIAGAVAVHDFFGARVPGVAGARPRFLLQVVAAVSMLPLSVRAISLFMQHNPNVGQARWGVYLAFIVGVTQFAFVIRGGKKIGQVTASAGSSGFSWSRAGSGLLYPVRHAPRRGRQLLPAVRGSGEKRNPKPSAQQCRQLLKRRVQSGPVPTK